MLYQPAAAASSGPDPEPRKPHQILGGGAGLGAEAPGLGPGARALCLRVCPDPQGPGFLPGPGLRQQPDGTQLRWRAWHRPSFLGCRGYRYPARGMTIPQQTPQDSQPLPGHRRRGSPNLLSDLKELCPGKSRPPVAWGWREQRQWPPPRFLLLPEFYQVLPTTALTDICVSSDAGSGQWGRGKSLRGSTWVGTPLPGEATGWGGVGGDPGNQQPEPKPGSGLRTLSRRIPVSILLPLLCPQVFK